MKKIGHSILEFILFCLIITIIPNNLKLFAFSYLIIAYTFKNKYIPFISLIFTYFFYNDAFYLTIIAVFLSNIVWFLAKDKIMTSFMGIFYFLFISLLTHFYFFKLELSELLIGNIIGLTLFILNTYFISFYNNASNKTIKKIFDNNIYSLIFITLFSTIIFFYKNDINYLLITLLILNLSRYKNEKIYFPLSLMLVTIYFIIYKELNSIIILLGIFSFYKQNFFKNIIFVLGFFIYSNYKINIPNIIFTSYILTYSLLMLLNKNYSSNDLFATHQKKILDDYIDITKTIQEHFIETKFDDKILEKRIAKVISCYCDFCKKKKNCFENKTKLYLFLKSILTTKDYKSYPCININEIDCLEKINYQLDIRNELKNLNTLLNSIKDELYIKVNSMKKYETLYTTILDQGYDLLLYEVDFRFHYPVILLGIENISKDEIQAFILKFLSKVLNEELRFSIISENPNSIFFKIYPKNKLQLTYAHGALSKDDQVLCGDNYYVKKEKNGLFTFALSDGMGSGYEAFYESSQILKLVSKLCNFTLQTKTIISLLQSIYEIQNHFEAYATLDFLRLDLYDQKCSLYKMGSTSTYILQNNNVLTIENNELPLEFSDMSKTHEFILNKGDIIFLCSDGLTNTLNDDEIKDLFLKVQFKKPNLMVESILDYIKQYQNYVLKDDVTIVVIELN